MPLLVITQLTHFLIKKVAMYISLGFLWVLISSIAILLIAFTGEFKRKHQLIDRIVELTNENARLRRENIFISEVDRDFCSRTLQISNEITSDIEKIVKLAEKWTLKPTIKTLY